ncbi:hypothetical protein ACUV84_001211 [Puccinellia chinampoensis]
MAVAGTMAAAVTDAATGNGTSRAVAADAMNLFVGVGGMGNLPGLLAVGGSYGGGFGNNVATIVFTSVMGCLGGTRGSCDRGADGVRPRGFPSAGTVFL